MKKITILFILLPIVCFLLTGCGEKITNEYGNEVVKIGPYIEISHIKGKDYYGSTCTFLTVYREDTKVVYEIVVAEGDAISSIHELYSCDKEGHPILQYYENGKIITK